MKSKFKRMVLHSEEIRTISIALEKEKSIDYRMLSEDEKLKYVLHIQNIIDKLNAKKKKNCKGKSSVTIDDCETCSEVASCKDYLIFRAVMLGTNKKGKKK